MGGQNLGKGPEPSRGHQQTIKEELDLTSSQQFVEPETPCGHIQSWYIQHLLRPSRLGGGGVKMKRHSVFQLLEA